MLTDINEAIQGQRQSWNLIKKLGEGDAGEVYLAESLIDKQPAILKRPRKGSFFSDILRQANQIKTEGSILHFLPGVLSAHQALHLGIPALVDQSRTEVQLGEGTFIVIELAPGLSLKALSQVIRFGPTNLPSLPTDPESAFLVQQWTQLPEFPAPFLVRILLGVLDLLDAIHAARIINDGGMQSGVVWNDVKPDHLYWDAPHACLTAIDWGNSQFLDGDGVTRDRQYSAQDDYRQFLQELGSFVAESNPDLHARLEWPEPSATADMYEHAIGPLKERLQAIQQVDSEQLRLIRQQEADLYATSRPNSDQLAQSSFLQTQLAAHGELPECAGALSFMTAAAYTAAADDHLAEFQNVCEAAASLPSKSSEKWKLLSAIAGVALKATDSETQSRGIFSNALSAGVAGDWSAALWELFASLGEAPPPAWWESISQEIRRVCLGLEPDALTLHTTFARLYYTLQAEITRRGNQRLRAAATGDGSTEQDNFHWQASEELLATYREEILNKWKEIAPSPPNSGLPYTEVDSLIDPIEELLPDSRARLEKSLAGAKAQVDLVLSAWEQKDFELARRGLRSILMWDPDRRRLITAEKAIAAAPGWLARVRKGASKDEPFYDFLTSLELAGRTLRNQVGPSKWLDKTLEAFKRLRRGTRSVDLMIEYPEIMQEMPWLNEYQSREILSLPHTRPISLERDLTVSSPASTTQGVVEGRFGAGQDLLLAEPLDTWAPEARGSSARVFAGYLRGPAKNRLPLAFKIMRHNQLDYALPLFIEEIQVLTFLGDVPGITPIVECGFIKFGEDQALPSDESHASADKLSGQIIHYGAEQAQNLLASMDRQLTLGWLPYLALPWRSHEYNLLRYCDAAYTHGWFLSLRDSLVLALQICDILQFAHDRNIVYRDHKLLHYYWDPDAHGVAMIDWNIARRQPQGLSDAEKQFDLVQFGARGLHHIFTGRPAQGSLPLGPNRPEDIEQASTHYPVSWTYDDERLPNPLRLILEQTLNQGYTQVRDIRQDLLEIYQQLPGTEKN